MTDYIGQCDELLQDPTPWEPDWHPLLRRYRAEYTREYWLTGSAKAARRATFARVMADLMREYRKH